MPIDVIAIRTKPHRFWYCCRQPTITPRPFPASSRMHAAIMLRDFTQPNKPQAGCARLAAVRLMAKCTDMLSLVSDYPHICSLPDLLQRCC